MGIFCRLFEDICPLVATLLIALIHCNAEEKTASFTEWRGKAWDATHAGHCPQSYKEQPPLLIISIDGFKPEYLRRRMSPALQTLKDCGVYADHMRPVFPTKTFPNHYTIATGLYPESHGIIANHMFDPQLNASCNLKQPLPDNEMWWSGEPIWLTAKRQGRKSAALFWPGSDVNISGEYPTSFYKYNKSVDAKQRIDLLLRWLTLDEDRPQILLLYLEQTDIEGHAFGPASFQVDRSLVQMDNVIDRLMNGLSINGLLGCINIIIISDHGMQFTPDERILHPLEILDSKEGNWTESIYFFGGTVGRYRLRNQRQIKELEARIVKDLECSSPHFLTVKKEDLPFRLHYSRSERIEHVISLVEPGWQALKRGEYKSRKGNHGYDNIAETMQAIFVAYGPAFKRNYTIEPFENIELYNLFCELTNLIPVPNNGTPGALHHLLKQPRRIPAVPEVSFTVNDFPSPSETADGTWRSDCQCHENITEKLNISELINTHLPWGIPFHHQHQRLLVNKNYINSYDTRTRHPRWIAFKMTSFINRSTEACWMAETRLNQRSCSQQFNRSSLQKRGIVIERLFQPSFSTDLSSETDSNWLSNAVLMFDKFRSDIFFALIKQMEIWFKKFGTLHVILGPIFDFSLLSQLPDFNIPTDFFAIFLRCVPIGSSECEVDSLAFILPHRKERSSCQTPEQFFRLHIARIRDIELKTGLEFFISNPTLGLKQRLKLEVAVWEEVTRRGQLYNKKLLDRASTNTLD